MCCAGISVGLTCGALGVGFNARRINSRIHYLADHVHHYTATASIVGAPLNNQRQARCPTRDCDADVHYARQAFDILSQPRRGLATAS
jgi:hypothetical protein